MPRPNDPRLVDELTGLSNEWHFKILFDFAFAAGDRGIPVSLAIFELIGFEEFRQREGSDRATEALQHFAGLFAATSREMDVTVRLHGARFLSLLRDCNMQGGLVFADRVQVHTATVKEKYGLPVAAGVATYDEGMQTSDDLMKAARAALARAVESGEGIVSTPRDA